MEQAVRLNMVLPIEPVTMPTDLVGKSNGNLPGSLLQPVGPSGMLHHKAARAFKALQDACFKQGLPLTYTYGGTYRSYEQQVGLFVSRYEIGGVGGGCKRWQDQLYCKKASNLATAAVPGTSNHGWGLAIDTAFDNDLTDGVGPDDAVGITSHPKWKWFLENAPLYGFSWELQSEPWHIRYIKGDNLPQIVLDYENPPKPPPPIPLGEIMYIAKPNEVLTNKYGNIAHFAVYDSGITVHASGPDYAGITDIRNILGEEHWNIYARRANYFGANLELLPGG